MVRDSIINLGHDAFFLDQRNITNTSVNFSIGDEIHGQIRSKNNILNIEDISSVYWRPYDSRMLPEVESEKENVLNHVLLVDDMLFSLFETISALVVNRPGAMSSNSSKPFQASIIRKVGFDIPDTILTTDPKAVLEFWESHEKIIYKSISGVRSIVKQFTDEHMSRLTNVTWCPTQFQEYVEGTDYRVHVVEDKTFACKISSAADDYRYASNQGLRVDICDYDIPRGIADMCIKLTETLGLAISGIDLRKTPDDKWYCFEANPSPGFSYYQEQTGQKISDEIASLLIRGTK